MTSRLFNLCAVFVMLTFGLSFPASAWQSGGQLHPNSNQAEQAQAQQQANGSKNLGALNAVQTGALNPLQNGPQAAPQRPFPPLAPALQARVEQLLKFWENSSSQIQLYECDFTRWEYNPRMCNWRNPENNHLAAMAISKGKIRYGDPDKGMYEVVQKWHFAGPPEEDGGKPKYAISEDETEKWICDGVTIYEFDFTNKRLYDLELPPQAQGEGLKNSPLPFVFGAKADDLLERYWVREVVPPNAEAAQNQFWLEVWPKRANDAQAYKKVEIILSRDPFLPQSIHLYAPNYDEKLNPAKMVFEFENRQINGHLLKLKNFFGYFIRPNTPRGWKRVPKKLIQDNGRNEVPQVGQAPGQQNSK